MDVLFRAQKALYFVVLAIFVLFLWNDEATSNSETAHCSGSWAKIVLDVEAALNSSLRPRRVVLFAGQDGRIFDCLNQNVPQASIDELQFWETALVRLFSDDPFYDTNPPPNFCNTSYGAAGSAQAMIIHLPYERGELDDPTCLIRLRNLPETVNAFLEKEQ